jgi:uncharacterized protein YpmB
MRNKWIWVGLFVVVTSIILISRFYITVQQKHWQEQAATAAEARTRAHVTNVTDVEPFYGDIPMSIIFGDNEQGQKVIVWMSENDVHTELADTGLNKEQALALFQQRQPGAKPLRIMPGKIQDQYVWEVFYKKTGSKGTQYFYDYYRFKDGVPVDMYNLNIN